MKSKRREKLDFNNFIGITVFGHGEKQKSFVFGCCTFKVWQVVVERIMNICVMVVTTDAENQGRVFMKHRIEVVCHIVVELFGERDGMHGDDGARDGGGDAVDVALNVVEVRDIVGIVVFEGIGVEADKMEKSGIETEIVRAVDFMIGVFAGAEAIMISDDAEKRHFETGHDVSLPNKLFGESEVGLVAGMNHEIDMSVSIDGVDKKLCFVVPALGVADLCKANGVLMGTGILNAVNHLLREMGGTVNMSIVGMIFNEVAGWECRQK